MVKVKPIGHKRPRATAGRHALVTDRKIEEGGEDVGCTSGELLLLAIGSCATGSLRNFMEASSLAGDTLEVDVSLEPSAKGGETDMIAIDVSLPADMIDANAEAIDVAARSGRVVSRMALGSPITVRCHPFLATVSTATNQQSRNP